MTLDPDHLHRTVKLEIDSGTARTYTDAERIVRSYVLQILVGSGVAESQTRQATLLTAVNAGSRAFLGGVRVKLAEDFVITTPWDRGRRVKETLGEFGGVSFVDELDPERPVIVVGHAAWDGELPLYTTWEGWTGGIVTAPDDRLAEQTEFALAGVLSGGIAVSETFQRTRGYPVAAARNVGISLWRPDLDWRDPDAVGPELAFLPNNFWLLGLGHLGQAYAWAIGFLPFAAAKRSQVRVMLQDFDEVVDANEATSMLVRRGERDLKTRLVERQLESLGLQVRRTDRRFDEHLRRDHDNPAEPVLAIAGFDKIEPRRLLDDAGFRYVVDGGIGVGPVEYLGIDVRTFPSTRTAKEVFGGDSDETVDEALLDQAAYRAAAEQAVSSGEAATLEAARCGLIDVAGKAAGAAFVGTVVAAIAVSDLLRIVNGGDQYEAVSINLRTPDGLTAYSNPEQAPVTNPGYVEADRS